MAEFDERFFIILYYYLCMVKEIRAKNSKIFECLNLILIEGEMKGGNGNNGK